MAIILKNDRHFVSIGIVMFKLLCIIQNWIPHSSNTSLVTKIMILRQLEAGIEWSKTLTYITNNSAAIHTDVHYQ